MFKIVPHKNGHAVYDSGILVFSGTREQCEGWAAAEVRKLHRNNDATALRRAFS
jgi:hypothetical protein